MKQTLVFLLIFCLLLLGGCRIPAPEPPEGSCQLYYVAVGEGNWSSALASEAYLPPEGANRLESLLNGLFQGPSSSELRSPIPAGTHIKTLKVELGVVYLDLSESYAGLFGMEQTLADACITLTLCQLEEVDGVSIMVDGRQLLYQNQEILSPSLYILEEITIDSESGSK